MKMTKVINKISLTGIGVCAIVTLCNVAHADRPQPIYSAPTEDQPSAGAEFQQVINPQVPLSIEFAVERIDLDMTLIHI